MIIQKPTVVVEGRTWSLFDVQYSTPDGTYSTYIYALSFAHAAMILDDLKQTARIGGQVLDVVRG